MEFFDTYNLTNHHTKERIIRQLNPSFQTKEEGGILSDSEKHLETQNF